MTSRTMQTEKAVTLVQDQPEGGCGLKNRRWISVKYIIGEVLLFWLVALFVCLLSGSGKSFCRFSLMIWDETCMMLMILLIYHGMPVFMSIIEHPCQFMGRNWLEGKQKKIFYNRGRKKM